MRIKQSFELLMICIIIGIGIVYLRLFAPYPQGVINLLSGIRTIIDYYVEIIGLSAFTDLLNRFTANQILFIIVLLQIVKGAVLILLFKDKFIKGSKILNTNLFRTIRWGMILYLLVFSTMVVMLVSVAGMSIGLLVALIIIIVSILGGVSIAIYIGTNIGELLGIRSKSVYVAYMLGEFVYAICINVSVLVGVFILFILPVLSFGVIWCYIMDKYIYKGTPMDDDSKMNRFDRDRIRDIITNGVNNES